MVQNIPLALMIQKSFNDALLKISLETSPVFIGVLAVRDYQFLYVNQYGFELLGYKNLEEINESIQKNEFRKHDNLAENREERLKKIVIGKEYKEENEFLKADGSSFWSSSIAKYSAVVRCRLRRVGE